MTTKSSFLPRFSRSDIPVLPFHNPPGSPIRKKPSEYDLSDLSPRPGEPLLTPKSPSQGPGSSSRYRSSSPSTGLSDNVSSAGSSSKMKPRVLFAGPPPPIAASRVFYRDEEDRAASATPRNLEASSFARNINSVLFDRSSSVRTRGQAQEYEPDAVWRNLQRRENALQKELQYLLDAQSAGLAVNLDPHGAPPSSARSNASDAGSSTPTGTLYTDGSTARRSHIIVEQPTRATPAGEIIPVRQPRKKPLSLRAARTGLARNIALLADLKIEEDANLAAALSTRKKALSQLRRLSAKKEGIAEELRILESDDEEPLARELRELGDQHASVTTEIAELEERLVGLRNRKRWLDGRILDVRNRREAGLSGYKGALKEVDSKLSAMLKRPPVKPLDIEAIAGPQDHGTEDGSKSGDQDAGIQSPGGTEFLRMRPERRTVEMAKEWWESEVALLERRKGDVDKERSALEEGVEVWRGAIKLVADFEADLRSEMTVNGHDNGGGESKGKIHAPTPEQAMFAQLDKMATVMTALDERLHLAEEKGWNLLICAIGAELEAFREADIMLRDALRAAGYNIDHDSGGDIDEHDELDTLTPQLGVSAIARTSVSRLGEISPQRGLSGSGGNITTLVDVEHEDKNVESDNEVPADLLVTLPQDHDSPTLSREDSENEVPPEFLAQHHEDDL
ncbi:hypothetical protein B0T24DRAFT_97880 [Lasiosphaeria ovina]|uniref:Autophagy-related protein 28 n=1 Tax=Lasiosphaeria ovina TaxID=92902 RepID=A0AAE0JVG9_9PEZI|nr:hypothetical protein B0T24DRAFT_97880 [Lasiosphaeria ovina]